MIFFFDANRYSSIFADKVVQNKEIGSLWLGSWRDIDYNVHHDLLHKAETNNQAEYGSMLFILHHIKDVVQKGKHDDNHPHAHRMYNWLTDAIIVGDSQLVVRQMQGMYKVKEENLRPLWLEAINLVHVLKEQLGVTVTFEWVRREVNNQALKISKKLEGKGPVFNSENQEVPNAETSNSKSSSGLSD